jgi:hypothetical protein
MPAAAPMTRNVAAAARSVWVRRSDPVSPASSGVPLPLPPARTWWAARAVSTAAISTGTKQSIEYASSVVATDCSSG